jgi:hypothetical protein
MVRMIAILALFGLVWGGIYTLAGSSSAVQVTFFGGGLPTPDPSNFEDCGPSTFGSKPVNDDCYAYLKPGNNDPMECDYTVGFRASDVPVSRLRVKMALMRDGKVLSRNSVQIASLDRPADDPYVTKTFRAACDAKQLRILEAHAFVAGQDTDLIATESIASKGLMPFFSDLFIKIGPVDNG